MTLEALERAPMQFNGVNSDVDVALTNNTYTMRRNIGSGLYWSVDLLGETIGAYFVRSLASHRISGAETTELGVPGSAWERALTVAPTNGTKTFVGTRAHGYEQDTSISVLVNGIEVTPTSTPTSGQQIHIKRTSNLYHPDATFAIADCVTRYTMVSAGMTVRWSVTWLTDGTAGQCYGAMFPCAAILDTGKTTSGSKATLNSNDNSVASSSQSLSCWLWDADGQYGAVAAIRDLDTVFSWNYQDGKNAWIQDRAAASFNKIYFGYTGPSFQANTTWTGSCFYSAHKFGSLASVILDF